ncbi:MAG TPA: methionyl-tRNA formyltransferase [Candidatus Cloacimonadota bacterium]|nr:methionyl-tRNA formyltransferase [Candidatus Cloacimonadota bacterium]
MKNRRLIFCGASEFALPALKALAMVDYPLMVISIPPKAMGRRLKVQENVVAQAAKELNLPLFCPEDVNSEESLQEIRSFEPDIIITASFGAFLGKRLRELCLCINLHPSLLPLLRGATPIQSSLLQGFDRTGVSIFEMVKKMDAGSIRMQKELLILDEDNYSSLHEKLSELAASILLDFLDNPASYPAIEQDDTRATYCSKIDTSDLEIDWNQDAQTICNQVRAFSTDPGARTFRQGKMLKILSTSVSNEAINSEPGTLHSIVKNTGFIINCGSGTLLINQVQAQGKKQMSAHSYVLGARLEPHELFGS